MTNLVKQKTHKLFIKNIAKKIDLGYNKIMLNMIVAPREHNPKAERAAKKIVKYLKTEQVEYSVYFSQSMDSVKENTRSLIANGEYEFVVIGDDVVIHNVVNCFKDLNKAKIGIVPVGKDDDFSAYLGISHNPIQAIKDVLQKHVHSIDLLIVNSIPVINNIVIGASVEIFHQYNNYKIKNALTKKYATRKYGNSYVGIDLFMDNKNKSKKETVFELVIANGGFSKNKPVSPLANMSDGLFNLNYTTVANKHGRNKFIKQFNKGEHIYDADTKQFWLNTLKITNPERKIKTLIDGKISMEQELNVSILEKALKIYTRP